MIVSLLFVFNLIAIVLNNACAHCGQLGFNLGTVRNVDFQSKETSDYENEFAMLRRLNVTLIKTFASSGEVLQRMTPALVSQDMTAVIGLWTTDNNHFEAEKEALMANLPSLSRNNVEAICVGSEAMYREELTAADVADKVNQVKNILARLKDKDNNSFADVPVGTAETWNIWANPDNEIAIKACDALFVNLFPYWQGASIDDASGLFFDGIRKTYAVLNQVDPLREKGFYVGETGWPTQGTNFQAAVPSLVNARRYWKEAVMPAVYQWNIKILAFEAFDELWKPDYHENTDVERHWGILFDDGTPKYDVSNRFLV